MFPPPRDWCGTPRLRSVRTRPVGHRVEIAWCVAVGLTGYGQIAVAWHGDAVHCVDGLVVHGLAVGPGAGEFVEIGQKRSEDAAGPGCDAVRSPHVVRALEGPHIGLPEPGLPLYRLIPAYEIQMILEHYLDDWSWRNFRMGSLDVDSRRVLQLGLGRRTW